jgi:hypothetical protein
MGTAYLSESGDQIVTVYVNLGSTSVELQATCEDHRTPTETKRYLTDETNNLSFVPEIGESFMIPVRSVYTVVYDF